MSGASDSRKVSRRPYVAPTLQFYGSVAKLTRTGTGSFPVDGGVIPGMQMTCL